MLLITNTIAASRRSGIHRVAVELARNLNRHVSLDLVKWDEQDGQLRFADRRDFDKLFGRDRWPDNLHPRPIAHKVRYRFGDELDLSRSWWLINPEICYHAANGIESFARLTTQCSEYGVRIASILYDIIPITNDDYVTLQAPHLSYMTELARGDLAIAISDWSAQEARRFYRRLAPSARHPAIEPLLLPDLQRSIAGQPHRATNRTTDTVVMIGTVEPRKRQVEFLRAFIAAGKVSEAVCGLSIFIAGSLHHDVADEFGTLLKQLHNAKYADYADEARIDAAYDRALFSAFVSNDEGYGLPIAESLAHGVPCLCADFGSMAEVAAGGGCLTVNVNSIDDMRDAIVRLAEDMALRERLAHEIADRRFRDWSDYAGELEHILARQPVPTPAAVSVIDVPTAQAVESATEAEMTKWGEADVVCFASRPAADRFVSRAAEIAAVPLLPADLTTIDEVAARTLCIGQRRARALAVAAKERGYRAMRRAITISGQTKPWFLRIVISTYNRARFVHANVEWLLTELVGSAYGVELVVVDNASTDDTVERLAAFEGSAGFRLIVNTANVGMLGNLQVCSVLTGAEYVWIVGDDDYIVPDEFRRIMTVLEDNPGIPLAFTNFGVYHRSALAAGDSVPTLIGERAALCSDPAKSDIMPLRTAGSQHDNLFTAIYPIIWRCDVLGACFNYPFTGKPFGDLVESVPTTKLLLESYGDTDVYWHAPIGIVGNAHNSWSRHRPRWHGRLMPEVFELARFAGIDSRKLYKWSRLHVDLFDEAMEIARESNVTPDLAEHDLDFAWRVFRRRLDLGPAVGPRPASPN